MVFARNQDSASLLCQFWREHDRITKVYLARVKKWKPYHEEKMLEGRIELNMAPSEERLKWKVVETGGKPSRTLWKIHDSQLREDCGSTNTGTTSILLELTPLTGRTHQLRVHCASAGSPIEGDSLYGDEQIEWNPERRDSTVLCLHAHTLSFPHPSTGEIMKFTSMPAWYKTDGGTLD